MGVIPTQALPAIGFIISTVVTILGTISSISSGTYSVNCQGVITSGPLSPAPGGLEIPASSLITGCSVTIDLYDDNNNIVASETIPQPYSIGAIPEMFPPVNGLINFSTAISDPLSNLKSILTFGPPVTATATLECPGLSPITAPLFLFETTIEWEDANSGTETSEVNINFAKLNLGFIGIMQ